MIATRIRRNCSLDRHSSDTRPADSPLKARHQSDITIGIGRYGELFEYHEAASLSRNPALHVGIHGITWR